MMDIIGIYIYNADRNTWYNAEESKWGTFNNATEWPQGLVKEAEKIRVNMEGNAVTYTVALLH